MIEYAYNDLNVIKQYNFNLNITYKQPFPYKIKLKWPVLSCGDSADRLPFLEGANRVRLKSDQSGA